MRLHLLKRNVAKPDGKHWVSLYRCECGTKKLIRTDQVKPGNTTSCGCWQRTKVTTHGRTGTSEYLCWKNIRRRCYELNCKQYADYGGRGIQVCDRWRESFENFLNDMGLKPKPCYQIDRINNDGNYEPANCKWSTPSENSRNRRPRRTRSQIAGLLIEDGN